MACPWRGPLTGSTTFGIRGSYDGAREINPVHIPIAVQLFFFLSFFRCPVSYLASIGRSCLCYRSRPFACSVRRLCALIGCPELHGLGGPSLELFSCLDEACAKSFFVASGSSSGTSKAGRTDDARGAEVYYVAKAVA